MNELSIIKNKELPVVEHSFENQDNEKIDIWGEELFDYRTEVLEMGCAIMLFSGVVFTLTVPLSIAFNWAESSIQGGAFFIFTAGIAVAARSVLATLQQVKK
ncbi:MAG: hypothetical protein KC478_13015 [Bacteriovoracaceae bacterium]|nr:hypothetical protein [Bacteriovoracaceae bacterium]